LIKKNLYFVDTLRFSGLYLDLTVGYYTESGFMSSETIDVVFPPHRDKQGEDIIRFPDPFVNKAYTTIYDLISSKSRSTTDVEGMQEYIHLMNNYP
jgi:hypothetical protein